MNSESPEEHKLPAKPEEQHCGSQVRPIVPPDPIPCSYNFQQSNSAEEEKKKERKRALHSKRPKPKKLVIKH